MTSKSRANRPAQSRQETEQPRNPFADPEPTGDDPRGSDRAADDPTGSVSPDRAGELSADDKHAREIAEALDQQAQDAAPEGSEAVSPDRVGTLSAADQEAADAVPKATPESIERDQAAVDRRRVEEGGDPPPVRCHVTGCLLPEFLTGAGLCGGHWSNRPDLRKAAHTRSVKEQKARRAEREAANKRLAEGESDAKGDSDG